MDKGIEIIKRKTPLEMFKEIKELEVADSPLMTVEDCLPFMCEKVEQALQHKSLAESCWEIVKKYFDIEVDILDDAGMITISRKGSKTMLHHAQKLVKDYDKAEFETLKEGVK